MRTLLAEVFTHLVAFAIFVWILKRFAWTPLMAVLDRRREQIAKDMSDAEEARRRSLETEAKYKDKLARVEEEIQKKLNEAARQGRELSAQIQEEATQRAAEIRERARIDLEVERGRARQELKKEVVRLTIASVEQILKDGLDTEMQHNLLGHVMDRMEGEKGPDRAPSPGGGA